MITERFIDAVFDREGRTYGDQHTNPPIDQPTAAGGIILDTLREYVEATGAPLEVSVDTLKALTEVTSRPIVRWKFEQYAQTHRLDQVVDPALREQLLDWCYNSGPGIAIRWLQRVLRVTPDGAIGPQTLAALAAADAWLVHHALIAARFQMIDMWTDAAKLRKQWEEGLENRALSFSLLLG